MNKATVYAKLKTVRISPKKVRPVLDLIRGKGAKDAKIILAFDNSKPAKITLKVLKSAIANAKNNLSMNESELFISDLQVSAGATYKRGRAGSRLRYRPIMKRTSHIIVGLSGRSK